MQPLKFRGHEFAAFLFDMDGTLLNSLPVVERVWGEWADRHGIDRARLLASVHGVRAEDIVRRFATDAMDIATEVEWLQQAEAADLEGIVPISGVNAFIESLDPAAWAIVTSAPRELAKARVRAVGLPVPATMIAAEDVSRGKPDPEGFLKAADALGVAISECLVFEDSAAGIAAARAAGAHVVVIGGQAQAPGALAAISDYDGV